MNDNDKSNIKQVDPVHIVSYYCQLFLAQSVFHAKKMVQVFQKYSASRGYQAMLGAKLPNNQTHQCAKAGPVWYTIYHCFPIRFVIAVALNHPSH